MSKVAVLQHSPPLCRVSLHYSRMSHHGIGEILVQSFVIKVYFPVPQFIFALVYLKADFSSNLHTSTIIGQIS